MFAKFYDVLSAGNELTVQVAIAIGFIEETLKGKKKKNSETHSQ